MSSQPNFLDYATQIEENLYLGSEDAGIDCKPHTEKEITHILIPAHLGRSDWKKYPEHLIYSKHHILDFAEFPIIQFFPPLISFIENALEQQKGKILIHCAQGQSRSATIVIAYLMKKHNWTFQESFSFVQKQRNIKPKFETQLKLWYELKFDLNNKISQQQNNQYLTSKIPHCSSNECSL
jgi:protein-tyrosine phosphatase